LDVEAINLLISDMPCIPGDNWRKLYLTSMRIP